jgi:hypothetical protein
MMVFMESLEPEISDDEIGEFVDPLFKTIQQPKPIERPPGFQTSQEAMAAATESVVVTPQGIKHSEAALQAAKMKFAEGELRREVQAAQEKAASIHRIITDPAMNRAHETAELDDVRYRTASRQTGGSVAPHELAAEENMSSLQDAAAQEGAEREEREKLATLHEMVMDMGVLDERGRVRQKEVMPESGLTEKPEQEDELERAA